MMRPFRGWALVLQCLCLVLCAGCQNPPTTGVSPSPPRQTTPTGWLQTGGNPTDIAFYTFGIDHEVSFRGVRSATLAQTSPGPAGVFGAFVQIVRADPFRGQRVRVTAYLKTQEAGGATMWARADGQYQGHLAALKYAETAELRQTQDWTQLEIELDVPPTGDTVLYGVFLSDTGRLWVDDVQVEAISALDPATPLPPPELWTADVEERNQARLRTNPPLEQPQNLDFEQ